MDPFGSMPMGYALSTNEHSRLTEREVMNFIYPLIVLSIAPVIEPSPGPPADYTT